MTAHRQNLPDKLRFQLSDEIVIEVCPLDEVTFGALAESKRDPKSPIECAPTPMLEQTPQLCNCGAQASSSLALNGNPDASNRKDAPVGRCPECGFRYRKWQKPFID